VYLELQKRLGDRLRDVLQAKYDLQLDAIPVEIPPDLQFGELATPIAFELARKLRKAPKIIAQEIVAALGQLEGFQGFEVAGAGYINARIDRLAAMLAIASEKNLAPPSTGIHALVEHTSINPNKAAHVGHLRNAILGDTFVRLLRAAGQKVDVQNYIDNTGVQVADVVVGFRHLEGMSLKDVRALIAKCENRSEGAVSRTAGAIDYYCWDLYARTSQWYEQGSEAENAARKKLRYATLHEIEQGGNDTAEVAEIISTAVLRRHLETMLRLDIEYDFLPRESEILHLKFWEAAFEQLKQTGVLYFEMEGKNKGCWVMTRPGAAVTDGATDEDAKVIVRSNGTVTYVGKDIAYHLWKFGLLGRDFGYKPFFTYPDHECWISTEQGDEPHPHFGGAQAIYNVIDARQSDPQANVIQALRGMGHTAQADCYTHFSYEMVALTPRCAVELGYDVSEEDLARPYIEVS
jgi:arginyl-tRNA synthetase